MGEQTGGTVQSLQEARELTNQAIYTVARHIVANMADEPEWENWPEIGEDDWAEVVKRVAQIAPYPDHDQFLAAYAYLTERADDTPQTGRTQTPT